MCNLKYVVAASLTMIVLFFPNQTSAQSEWKYEASLYGWFSGIDGTIGVANKDVQVKATASDLLGNLDFSMGGHFEASNPKLTFIADIFYVGLSQNAEISVADSMATIDGAVKVQEWVFEGSGGYRVTQDFTILLAGRAYSLIQDVTVQNTTYSGNKVWADIYLGARYLKNFGEKWYAGARADIGFGGSSFAWYGNVGVGYHFSDLFSLALAYRILSLDYSTGSGVDYFEYDVTNSGFGLGFVFSF